MDANTWNALGKHESFPQEWKNTQDMSLPPLGKLPRAKLWKKSQPQEIKCEGKNRKILLPPEQPNLPLSSYSQRECRCLGCCPSVQFTMTAFLKKFDRFLNKMFRKLGCLIAHYTGYFIIVPILLAFLASTGIQRAKYEADPEYLFAPLNGTAKNERKLIDDTFHMNFSSDFDPSRLTEAGKFVRYLISAKDGGTILRQGIWDELLRLDEQMKAINIVYEDKSYFFKDLCAIWNGECTKNKILGLSELIPEIVNGSLLVDYPVMLNPSNFDVYVLSIHFGGVTLDEETDTITDAKVLILNYWLKSGEKRDNERSQMWEKKVIQDFKDDDYKHIKVARYTSQTLENELEVNTISVIPYLGITVSLMILFSICSLFMSDWVRGKPLLGFFGILSALFACVTAFGILLYVGIPFIGINLAAPFLMLGIGIDDMFVLLGAWRRTRLQDSVEKRMGETYAEAAVSITITSLTDMVSFFVGIITPFPSVQIFCIYTGTAVLMTYLWQITFFGACMAIAGKLEANQKHSVCFNVVKAKSVAEKENGCCYWAWCSGGINRDDPWNPRDNRPHAIMLFFKNCLAKLLNIPFCKGIVILLFITYLAGSIYGCLMVREGLERRRLSRYDSYSVDYYDMDDTYFREYPYRIQVVISGNISYGDPETRNYLMELHEKFENQSYVAENLYTESWIRGWYEYLDNNARFMDIDPNNETDFIYNLRDIYLSGSDNVYTMDVKFNEDNTQILASRFIIQTRRVLNSNEDKAMMKGLREIAQESPLNVTVFHPLFVFFDQFMLVRSTTIKAITIAALIMMIMSLIFIPNPWCSLWVAFSIISIETGVVGYMTLWDVNLDSISMINLIMCIGFSVDFSAHISYAYLTAKVDTPEERVRECLFTLGLPILQGAVSTILGVVALVFAPSYIFITFFKTVFLVIFFGAMHGIFLLPVLLSILGPGSKGNNDEPTPYLQNNLSPQLGPETPAGEQFKEKKLDDLFSSRDHDSIDKDMGLGTSEESSSDGSLSKATGNSSVQATREEKASQEVYSNDAYVDDETEKSTKASSATKRSNSTSRTRIKPHRKPTRAESVD